MKRNTVFFLAVLAMICFARPVGAAFTNLLQDPGFEATSPNPYWAETSTNFDTPLCTAAACGDGGGTAGPRNGTVWGWFGGAGSNYEAGSLTQDVTIPFGVAKLEFYLWVGTTAGDSTDIFTAEIDNVTLFTADATQNSLYPAYTLVSLNVNAYADNAAHTVAFSSVTSGEGVNINLDDVALLSGPGFNLVIAKSGTGVGTVESTDGWINCGSDCTEKYDNSTEVTLTAAAASGSTFAGWSGGGCSGTDNCTLTLNDNQTITAIFNGPPTTTTSVGPTPSCIDNDGDGYGENCAAGIDCNDNDSFYNEICPDCTVKVIPKALGWFLGEKEKTRRLLVIGKRGTEFDDTTPVRWEDSGISVVSTRAFLKRFMFIKVSIDGAALDKREYRALIGDCSAKLTLVK